MGLANFTELKASIATWLKRPDLTSQIPDFITLAETELNKRIRSRRNVKRARALFNEEFESLPTDFLEVVDISLPDYPRHPLYFMEPSNFRPPRAASSAVSGTVPRFYTVIGTEMRFWPVPVNITAEIDYYAALTPLSVSNATNWLLTYSPSCYLYAALVEAAPALGAGQINRASGWSSLLTNAVDGVNADKYQAKNRAPLRTELPRLLMHDRRWGFDIETGW